MIDKTKGRSVNILYTLGNRVDLCSRLVKLNSREIFRYFGIIFLTFGGILRRWKLYWWTILAAFWAFCLSLLWDKVCIVNIRIMNSWVFARDWLSDVMFELSIVYHWSAYGSFCFILVLFMILSINTSNKLKWLSSFLSLWGWVLCGSYTEWHTIECHYEPIRRYFV